MRRKLRFLTAMAALAVVGAACAGGEPGDEPAAENGDEVELTWAIGGAEAQSGGVHQDVAALYSEETDGVTVTIDTLPDAADEQRQQQSLELNAQGEQFDILGMDVIWTGEYSTNGWLESLEDVRGDIEEASLEGAFESATWGGELWAAPYNTNAGFLYYRTDLVDEPPTTWDELKEVGLEAAEEEGISPYVAQGAQYEGFVVNWLELYWGAGGDLFNEDQTEVLFDEELATQATEFMLESNEDGFYASGFNTMMEAEAQNEFMQGNAVFMRNWPSFHALLVGEEDSEVADVTGIAPMPTFTGEGTISSSGGFNLAVSAFSSNIDAAKEFVLWASTNEEPQRMMAEAGLPPTLESVYDEYQDEEENPVMVLLGEVLQDTRPRPPAPDYNSLSVEIQQNMFPAYNGDQDPAAASEAVATFLEGMVQE